MEQKRLRTTALEYKNRLVKPKRLKDKFTEDFTENVCDDFYNKNLQQLIDLFSSGKSNFFRFFFFIFLKSQSYKRNLALRNNKLALNSRRLRLNYMLNSDDLNHINSSSMNLKLIYSF